MASLMMAEVGVPWDIILFDYTDQGREQGLSKKEVVLFVRAMMAEEFLNGVRYVKPWPGEEQCAEKPTGGN